MQRQLLYIMMSVVLLASCAQVNGGANNYQAIRNIGVISAIGHKVALQNTALLVFGNTYETVPTDSWRIDDDAQKVVAALLQPRFTVVNVSVDKEAFSTAENSWWATSSVPVEKLVTKLPNTDNVDAYLVISPWAAQDPIAGTNQYLRGLGLYRRGGFSEEEATFAFYTVSLVDAHFGKTIATGDPSLGKSSLFDLKLPWVGCPSSIWPPSAAAMNESQKETIRHSLMGLVEASLPWALYKMGLVAQVPSGLPAPDCSYTLPPESGANVNGRFFASTR